MTSWAQAFLFSFFIVPVGDGSQSLAHTRQELFRNSATSLSLKGFTGLPRMAVNINYSIASVSWATVTAGFHLPAGPTFSWFLYGHLLPWPLSPRCSIYTVAPTLMKLEDYGKTISQYILITKPLSTHSHEKETFFLYRHTFYIPVHLTVIRFVRTRNHSAQRRQGSVVHSVSGVDWKQATGCCLSVLITQPTDPTWGFT